MWTGWDLVKWIAYLCQRFWVTNSLWSWRKSFCVYRPSWSPIHSYLAINSPDLAWLRIRGSLLRYLIWEELVKLYYSVIITVITQQIDSACQCRQGNIGPRPGILISPSTGLCLLLMVWKHHITDFYLFPLMTITMMMLLLQKAEPPTRARSGHPSPGVTRRRPVSKWKVFVSVPLTVLIWDAAHLLGLTFTHSLTLYLYMFGNPTWSVRHGLGPSSRANVLVWKAH